MLYSFFCVASPEELLVHGLRALRESLAGDAQLNIENCAAGIVSADEKFKTIEGDELANLIELVKAGDTAPEQAPGDAPADPAPGDVAMEG